MPTYEYKCEECEYIFEKFHHISDEKVKSCPICGSPVKRLIGKCAGVIFKGNGFYITDYEHKNNIS